MKTEKKVSFAGKIAEDFYADPSNYLYYPDNPNAVKIEDSRREQQQKAARKTGLDFIERNKRAAEKADLRKLAAKKDTAEKDVSATESSNLEKCLAKARHVAMKLEKEVSEENDTAAIPDYVRWKEAEFIVAFQDALAARNVDDPSDYFDLEFLANKGHISQNDLLRLSASFAHIDSERRIYVSEMYTKFIQIAEEYEKNISENQSKEESFLRDKWIELQHVEEKAAADYQVKEAPLLNEYDNLLRQINTNLPPEVRATFWDINECANRREQAIAEITKNNGDEKDAPDEFKPQFREIYAELKEARINSCEVLYGLISEVIKKYESELKNDEFAEEVLNKKFADLSNVKTSPFFLPCQELENEAITKYQKQYQELCAEILRHKTLNDVPSQSLGELTEVKAVNGLIANGVKKL